MDEETIINQVKQEEAEERKKMVVISNPIIVEQMKVQSLDLNEEEVGLIDTNEHVEQPQKIQAKKYEDEDEDDDLKGWNK